MLYKVIPTNLPFNNERVESRVVLRVVWNERLWLPIVYQILLFLYTIQVIIHTVSNVPRKKLTFVDSFGL